MDKSTIMQLTNEQISEVFSILSLMTNEEAKTLPNDSLLMYKQCVEWKMAH